MTVMFSTAVIAEKYFMIGLTAGAVGKEDNYAENTGYVYQYGRSGRGCL